MRHTLKTMWWLAGIVFSLPPVLAQTTPEPLSIGAGTHLYLRCNSTSWDVNEISRLKAAQPEYLRELTFDVKEPWMTDAGDDCVITETPKLNAWGDWQNYYGGQLSYLRVPEATRIRVQSEPDASMNFRLRFPSLGRYRFTLNTRDGYFSIRKDAVPEAGDVAWTLPGNMLSDALGNLFLSNYYPQNSISLVNGANGLPLWTYKAESYISFYGKCNTKETVFVSLAGRVAALSLKDGREIWSTDLNGALQDAYGYLSCYEGHDQIYLSYGADRTHLVSLNRSNGKTLWTWTAPAYAGIMGVDGQRVFVSSYQDARTSLKALHKINGVQLWEADPGNGYHTLTEDGALFWVSGSQLNALSPGTGQTIWSYNGRQDDSIWLTFEQNGLYVHEKSRISSVEKKSGRILWTYDYSAFAEQYPYAQILKAGVVMVRVNDYNAGVSRQIALNSWTGRVLWEREEPGTSSYLSEDNLAGTWVISGKTIKSMDPWTGTQRWSYTLDSEVPWENIMSVLEQDRSTVYVAYGYVGSKYPPMGVLALDMKTGQVKWKNWMESSIYRVGGDSRTLILNAGYYGSTKALRK
jgi:outer membrane protein assembly factor BamB